jgi:carbohydrate-binding DOMON domain-containing protein
MITHHTHTLTLSHKHSLSLSLSHTHTYTRTHTYTLTHTLSLTHTQTHTYTPDIVCSAVKPSLSKGFSAGAALLGVSIASMCCFVVVCTDLIGGLAESNTG